MAAKQGDYVDPEEKKIEDARKGGKILGPDAFKTEAARKALYRLNMKNATKDETPTDMHARELKERQAKPFSYKKGGKVISGGIAKVHTGEKVLTKAEAKNDSRGKRVACKK